MVLHEIFRVLSHFPALHFMLYRGKSIIFETGQNIIGKTTTLNIITELKNVSRTVVIRIGVPISDICFHSGSATFSQS